MAFAGGSSMKEGTSHKTRTAGSLVPGSRYRPTDKDVDLLIDRASKHPLGLGFLNNGALDAVAAVFQVHAFVVDRARDRLGTQ